MIGQDDAGTDREGMTPPRRGDGLAQSSDLFDQQGLPPLQQVHREEEAPARYGRTTIVRHVEQNNAIIGVIALVEMADYAFGSNPPYESGLRSAHPGYACFGDFIFTHGQHSSGGSGSIACVAIRRFW